jgi:hypothetical protein
MIGAGIAALVVLQRFHRGSNSTFYRACPRRAVRSGAPLHFNPPSSSETTNGTIDEVINAVDLLISWADLMGGG